MTNIMGNIKLKKNRTKPFTVIVITTDLKIDHIIIIRVTVTGDLQEAEPDRTIITLDTIMQDHVLRPNQNQQRANN